MASPLSGAEAPVENTTPISEIADSGDESDNDEVDDLIFPDRTPEVNETIEDFWDDFEGKPRERGKKKAAVSRKKELGLKNGVGEASRALESSLGFHYDYLEAIFGLLCWLLVVTFLYQSSEYFGYTYHHLMYEVSHLLAATFVVPMGIVLGMYWWEVKKDGEEMLEVARFKSSIKRGNTRKKRKKKKKEDGPKAA